MQRTLFTTVAVAALAMAVTVPANANTPVKQEGPTTTTEYKDNGGYTTTTNKAKVDAQGTEVKAKSKVDVDVNDDGSTTKTTKQEHIADPRGTMNERANTTETKVEQKVDGYSRETRNSKSNAAGTSTLTKESRDVKVDAHGNVTETTKTDKVVDPKGLMNRESTTREETRVNGELITR